MSMSEPWFPEDEANLPLAEYLAAPDDDLVLAEMANDPTLPTAEGEDQELTAPAPRAPRRTANVLTPAQQRQVALWIVEGFSFKEAKEFMERDWGFVITQPTWHYYRQVRRDLLEAATQFLRDQYLRFGYSERGVRVHKLTQHAARLEKLIERRGMYSTDTHTINYGKKTSVVTAERFEAGLSKEYRETVAQIQKMLEPIEHLVLTQEGQREARLPDRYVSQIAAAMTWDAKAEDEEAS